VGLGSWLGLTTPALFSNLLNNRKADTRHVLVKTVKPVKEVDTFDNHPSHYTSTFQRGRLVLSLPSPSAVTSHKSHYYSQINSIIILQTFCGTMRMDGFSSDRFSTNVRVFYIYTVSPKNWATYFYCNFGKCWSIF